MGFEITRYRVSTSPAARLQRILTFNEVDVVLDVGANTGQFARELRSGGYKGKIVSFEPLSAAHDVLVHSSRLDALWSVAPPMAIGARDGLIDIHVAQNSFSSSILDILASHVKSDHSAAFIGHETVSMSRLDSIAPAYLDGSKAAFLKVDTQGYEAQVLEGAAGTLARFVGVQLELSLIPLYRDQPLFMDLVEVMDSAGFTLCGVIPGFADEETGRLLQFDGIFLRTPPGTRGQ